MKKSKKTEAEIVADHQKRCAMLSAAGLKRVYAGGQDSGYKCPQCEKIVEHLSAFCEVDYSVNPPKIRKCECGDWDNF